VSDCSERWAAGYSKPGSDSSRLVGASAAGVDAPSAGKSAAESRVLGALYAAATASRSSAGAALGMTTV
jgi:hypothetical protein